MARGAHRSTRARIYRDAPSLVHEAGSAFNKRWRERVEFMRGRRSGRRKSQQTIFAIRCALCRDFHSSRCCRRLYDTSARPVRGQTLRNDQGLCADSSLAPSVLSLDQPRCAPQSREASSAENGPRIPRCGLLDIRDTHRPHSLMITAPRIYGSKRAMNLPSRTQ